LWRRRCYDNVHDNDDDTACGNGTDGGNDNDIDDAVAPAWPTAAA
jgi:hypothetical protein